MANETKSKVEELVSAIRKAAKQLGCNESEERFQEVLFAIGKHKDAIRSCFMILSMGALKNIRLASKP